MSAALYSVRLMWHGGKGDLAADGVWITLRVAPPVLKQLGATEIEFTPEVNVSRLRAAHDPWRDMNAAERDTVRAWLSQIAASVRAAL